VDGGRDYMRVGHGIPHTSYTPYEGGYAQLATKLIGEPKVIKIKVYAEEQ